MGRKTIVKPQKKIKTGKPRMREQRRVFRKRFKLHFDGEPDSDMSYYDNGLEWMLDEPGDSAPDDD